MISFDQHVEISQEVLSQEVDGETVILDMRSENYFGLDEIGTDIWRLLKEQKTLQEVFDILLDEYEVEEQVLRQHLEDHISELCKAELISLKPVDQR
ncbi:MULTISPECIES: PqqD family protein [Desulfosediminicola]|uniref:PqqD family protein n=1 Tax=Desulfosediminicola TaxID=2886823 RepID=UPI0010ACFC69|nr:PqqD family peptide modification chaperone [Desulfosediminicola ganghwensis]